MNRLLFSAIAGATVALGAMGTASAAPLSLTQSAAATQNAVEKVHGYHRSCAGDPDYLHRHSPSGRRIECGRRHYYRDSGPNVILRFGNRDRDHDRRGWRHRRDRD